MYYSVQMCLSIGLENTHKVSENHNPGKEAGHGSVSLLFP